MKSRFKLWAFLPILLIFPVVYLLYSLLFFSITFQSNKSLIPIYFVIGLLVYIVIWLVFGELRTKIIKVTINKEKIISNNFLGFGKNKEFYFNELKGFTISHLPSKVGTYEYLYLILKNKKVVKLSQFYHINFNEIKGEIMQKTKFLGIERFSYFRELREIFN